MTDEQTETQTDAPGGGLTPAPGNENAHPGAAGVEATPPDAPLEPGEPDEPGGATGDAQGQAGDPDPGELDDPDADDDADDE